MPPTRLRTPLLSLLVLSLSLPAARADICTDWRGYQYECNSGLSLGARWGIGVGIALLIIAIAMTASYYRRKRIMNAWSAYTHQQPNTQYSNNATGDQYAYQQNPNAYANNNANGYSGYNYHNNAQTQGLKQPQQAYQPSMAGAYGQNGGSYNYGQYNTNVDNNANGNQNGGLSSHDYEYQQAEENRRREEEEARAAGNAGNAGQDAPPGYDVSGGQSGNAYAPPAGSPPANRRQGSQAIV